ncbi:MAG: di-trans,poly-cis-decaprenylcistransferase [Holosporaceae bacterium]|jgi:undecaprenyl diphosphate synthase|nr:di-trans,poly-cis-decaprenylcistransferase [Holosporaceae bacterium]
MSESSSPQHIAFILDGNRRWAAAHNLPLLSGHSKGYETAKSIIQLLPKYDVQYATLYMFSTENWKRSKEEVDYLMNFFNSLFSDASDFMTENNIKVIVIGDLEKLPPNVLEKIEYIENITKNNTRLTLMLAISYGGRDEIIRAVKKIVRDKTEQKISAEDITEETFASYLDTCSFPYPDAMVRTSEKRISNFLIWQSAYSEMFFIDKLWPDFNEDDLKYIISEFLQRKRRYGK